MKFKMFSVVVGSAACIAHCPFCVSCEPPTKDNLSQSEINLRNLKIAGNLANRSNIDTVMVTSKGEPLLFPDEITQYLETLQEFKFPFIELQTNGILLSKNRDKLDSYLKKWYDLGLTTITISVVSNHYEINKRNYMTNGGEYIDIPELIEYLHQLKFSVRLTCICCKNIMDTPEKIKDFVLFAKKHHVEQVTMRPLNDEYAREETHQWILKNKMTEEDKEKIRTFLDTEGTKLLDLSRIGSVYDLYGQNIMFSVPLTKYTRDTNPDNLRNLIFFRNGHIGYEWEMDGGILL